MSRVGNQNTKGQVRAEIIGGPDIQFVEGSNSGLFTSITYNGVGSYTLGVNPGTPLPTDGSAKIGAQIEGAVAGNVTTAQTDSTTIEVRTFAGFPPVAADVGFGLTVTEQLFG